MNSEFYQLDREDQVKYLKTLTNVMDENGLGKRPICRMVLAAHLERCLCHSVREGNCD